MKKYLLLAPLAILLGTSCNKTYTCACNGSLANIRTTFPVKAKNMQDAKKTCESYNKPEVDGWRDCRIELK